MASDLEGGQYERLLAPPQDGVPSASDGEVATEACVVKQPTIEKGHTQDNERDSPYFLLKFAAELILLTMCLYYVDLAFDMLALSSFLDQGQYWWFSLNLGAIMMTLVLTGVELYMWSKEFEMTQSEYLVLGMSYPFCMHVATLVFLSISYRKLHPALEATKFAEAGIEAVVSAGVQLYSIMFCNSELAFATCNFTHDQRHLMMLSVASSCGSIAVAFSMFDLRGHGASGFPGSINSKTHWKFLLVMAFRFAEVGSRLLTAALFHFVTRPNGGFVMVLVDFLCVTLLVLHDDGNKRYIVPCMCCLVNPLFEESNVLSISVNKYYSYRVLHLVGLVVTAAWYNPTNLRMAWNMYPLDKMCILMVVLTITWMVLLPVIRCMSAPSMQQNEYRWGYRPFSAVQLQVRERMLNDNADLVVDWLRLYRDKLKEFLEALDKVSKEEGDDIERKLQDTTAELLNYDFNMPRDDLDLKTEKTRKLSKERCGNSSKKLAEKLAEEHSQLVVCQPKPHDLRSMLFWSLAAAVQRREKVVLTAVMESKVWASVFSDYVSSVLHRYYLSSPKLYAVEEQNDITPSTTYSEMEVNIFCDAGHRMNRMDDLGSGFAGICDICKSRAGRRWACLLCEITTCDDCYRANHCQRRRQQRLTQLSQEEEELTQLLRFTNAMMKELGSFGADAMMGKDSGCPVQASVRYLQNIPKDGTGADGYLRGKPAVRAGLDMLAPLVSRQVCNSFNSISAKDKIEFFDRLCKHPSPESAVHHVLPWFPFSVDVPNKGQRLVALEILTRLYTSGAVAKDDVLIMCLIVDFVVSVCWPAKEATKALRDGLSRVHKMATSAAVQREAFLLDGFLSSTAPGTASGSQTPLATAWDKLRELNGKAEEFKRMESKGRGKNLEAWSELQDFRSSVKPLFEDLMKHVTLAFKESRSFSIHLAAQVLEMLHVWRRMLGDISSFRDHVVAFLPIAIRLGIVADPAGCDAVLPRVVELVLYLFRRGNDMPGETKTQLLKSIQEEVDKHVRPDEHRQSVIDLFLIYSAGKEQEREGQGEAAAKSGRQRGKGHTTSIGSLQSLLPRVIKQPRSLYILLPSINWTVRSKKGAKCNYGHCLQDMASRDGDKVCDRCGLYCRADETRIMGCKTCAHYVCPACSGALDAQDFLPTILEVVQNETRQPDQTTAPTLLSRALPILAGAPKEVLLKNSVAVFQFYDAVKSSFNEQDQQYAEKLMSKIKPIGTTIEDNSASEFGFTLLRDWPGHPDGSKEKGTNMTLKSVLQVGKIVVCCLHRFQRSEFNKKMQDEFHEKAGTPDILLFLLDIGGLGELEGGPEDQPSLPNVVDGFVTRPDASHAALEQLQPRNLCDVSISVLSPAGRILASRASLSAAVDVAKDLQE